MGGHSHPQARSSSIEDAVFCGRRLAASTTALGQERPICGVRAMSANVLAACFIIDLPDLGGAEKIRKLGVPVRTLVSFKGH